MPTRNARIAVENFVLGVIADSGPCLTCALAQIVKVEEDPQQKFFLTRSIIACIL